MPERTHTSPKPARRPLLRPLIGWAGAAAVGVGLAAFFVGRIASDRWGATQYLHWLPAVPVLVICLLALALSRAAWRRSRPLRRVQLVSACVLVLGAGWVAVLEWRLHHVFRSRPGGLGLTIVHFNASGKPSRGVLETVTSLEPDFVIFANLRDREALPGVREALSTPEVGANLVNADRFTAVSRYRIIEFGRMTLGFEGAVFLNRDLPDLRDPGTAAWFRLDTTALLGRELIVWAVDMPSDPRLARWDVMTKSMDAIEGWALLSAVRQDGGHYIAGPEHAPGFPAPDVVIGDFNTPGGSAAVTELGRRAGLIGGRSRRFVDAHEAAGLGPDATFPGFFPRWLGWGIDRALVCDELAVIERDTRAVGSSQHRAQRVTVGLRAR